MQPMSPSQVDCSPIEYRPRNDEHPGSYNPSTWRRSSGTKCSGGWKPPTNLPLIVPSMPAHTVGLMGSLELGHSIMRFMSTYQCLPTLTSTNYTDLISNRPLIHRWSESGDYSRNTYTSKSTQTRQLVFGSSRTAGRLTITGSECPVSTPEIRSFTTSSEYSHEM